MFISPRRAYESRPCVITLAILDLASIDVRFVERFPMNKGRFQRRIEAKSRRG
jgi:hypothetical protein